MPLHGHDDRYGQFLVQLQQSGNLHRGSRPDASRHRQGRHLPQGILFGNGRPAAPQRLCTVGENDRFPRPPGGSDYTHPRGTEPLPLSERRYRGPREPSAHDCRRYLFGFSSRGVGLHQGLDPQQGRFPGQQTLQRIFQRRRPPERAGGEFYGTLEEAVATIERAMPEFDRFLPK